MGAVPLVRCGVDVSLTSFTHRKSGAALPPTHSTESKHDRTRQHRTERRRGGRTRRAMSGLAGAKLPSQASPHFSPLCVSLLEHGWRCCVVAVDECEAVLTVYEEVAVVEVSGACSEAAEGTAVAVHADVERSGEGGGGAEGRMTVEHSVAGIVVRRPNVGEGRVAATELPLTDRQQTADTNKGRAQTTVRTKEEERAWLPATNSSRSTLRQRRVRHERID